MFIFWELQINLLVPKILIDFYPAKKPISLETSWVHQPPGSFTSIKKLMSIPAPKEGRICIGTQFPLLKKGGTIPWVGKMTTEYKILRIVSQILNSICHSCNAWTMVKIIVKVLCQYTARSAEVSPKSSEYPSKALASRATSFNIYSAGTWNTSVTYNPPVNDKLHFSPKHISNLLIAWFLLGMTIYEAYWFMMPC